MKSYAYIVSTLELTDKAGNSHFRVEVMLAVGTGESFPAVATECAVMLLAGAARLARVRIAQGAAQIGGVGWKVEERLTSEAYLTVSRNVIC